MKHLLLSLATAATLIPAIASAESISNVLDLDAHLNIASRVESGQMETDLNRVEYTKNAAIRGLDIMKMVCAEIRTLQGKDTSSCGAPSAGRTRQ